MKPIANPYAKKRVALSDVPPIVKTTNNSSSTSASSHQQPTAANSIPAHYARPSVTTFSQAFEAIEDCDIYQNQQLQHREDAAEFQARTEQRAFEAAISTSDPPQAMSDRDNHAFLHQPHVLYISVKQRGNGVLDYIRNVPTAFQKMVPDYIFSPTSCALFLSIKYHNLYPEYIYRRIAALRNDFTLRVLLLLVDCEDNAAVLLQLNKAAVTHNMTLILAWSEEEAARYLETFKALDGKDAASIQRNKEQTHFADQVTDFLTTCKGINKTDAASVLTQFGSVRTAMAATPDELALISGLGEVKVKRLYDAFHKPFSSKAARKRQQKRKEEEDECVLREQLGDDYNNEAEFEGKDENEKEKSTLSN
jgi:DNA excision repair protein ERCC-1